MAHILILEDEAPLRRLLVDVLKEAGHRVTAAADGFPSSDADLLGDVDVVVTDVMMPGCDGLEVVRNVRAANPATRIVAMSGGGRTVSIDFLPGALALGADVVLYKPFLPDELVAAVARLLPGAAPAQRR